MFNPIRIIAILSVLAGWHLDAIDQSLIEKHRARLSPLNAETEQAAIISRQGDKFTVLEVNDDE